MFPRKIRQSGQTVTIYRNTKWGENERKYAAYLITWYQEGQRKQKSVSDRRIAEQEATRILNDLCRHRVASIKFTTEDREALSAARNHLRELGVDVVTACSQFAQAAKILGERVTIAGGSKLLETAP